MASWLGCLLRRLGRSLSRLLGWLLRRLLRCLLLRLSLRLFPRQGNGLVVGFVAWIKGFSLTDVHMSGGRLCSIGRWQHDLFYMWLMDRRVDNLRWHGIHVIGEHLTGRLNWSCPRIILEHINIGKVVNHTW